MQVALESFTFRLALVDETDYYHGQPKGLGKIFGVYLYEVDRVVHCCELTGSRECHYVGWHTEHWPFSPDLPEHESGVDWLDDANCDSCGQVRYFHCYSADALPSQDWGTYEGDYEEALEQAIEDYHCNPAY